MKTLAPPIQTLRPLIARSPVRKAWLSRTIVRCQRYFSEKPAEDRWSFLISTACHTLLLIVLALIWRTNASPKPNILHFSMKGLSPSLDATFELSLPKAIEPSELASDSSVLEAPSLFTYQSTESELLKLENKEVAPKQLRQLQNHQSDAMAIQLTALKTGEAAFHDQPSTGLFQPSSLLGRSLKHREQMALQNGGTLASEAAVEAALAWFSTHQNKDGSWSTCLSDEPCRGQCANETSEPQAPKRIGATGLALLCYLGAGYTHREGPYRMEVYRALRYLTESMIQNGAQPKQRGNEGRFTLDTNRYEMYEHGIAVLALCEAYQMTSDPILAKSCQMGINFLYPAQFMDGSWGYRPRETGDLSIVGWQMMAMRSAMTAKLDIRRDVILKVDRFLDSQQSDNGAHYGYRSRRSEPCMTAIGLLMRLYRGWHTSDPRMMEGTRYLSELGPSSDSMYYNYYATQLLFLTNHPGWTRWNERCRDYLVDSQSKLGHEKGSWYFDDKHANLIGGRHYVTAMATLTLEVYYRHMPIYRDLTTERFDF
jgi:hypothetical protein